MQSSQVRSVTLPQYPAIQLNTNHTQMDQRFKWLTLRRKREKGIFIGKRSKFSLVVRYFQNNYFFINTLFLF